MNLSSVTRHILPAFCAVLSAGGLARPAGASHPAGPQVRQIAPGIWRLRFGQPEKVTPLTFRSTDPRAEAIAALPEGTAPFDLKTASFVASGRGCAITLPLAGDEHVYGFGLSPQLFDMTGRRVFIRPSDHPENDLNESHAPVPFYVSTAGYGVYVDTARYASFYTGSVHPAVSGDTPIAPVMLVDIPSARGADVYVFGGPSMAGAVQRYNLFSGGGCVPPLWGLGMYYRGLGAFSADDSTSLAKSFRDQHIPTDVWGLEPGWQTKTYSSSFVWNTKTFPDPDAFVRRMHDIGYRLNVWEHAFTHPSSPIFEPLKPWSGDYTVWGGLVPDFASPQGKRIFQDHQDGILFGKGVDSVKLDECDNQPSDAKPWSFPEAAVFPSGLDGEQMHSLFGMLYQRTMLEPVRKRNARNWNLVRNSHALAAPMPYALYSDTYDHRGYVRALVNEGFSGLMWCPEVRDSDSVEELYRRVETVVFAPLAQIDAWYMKLPPWLQMNHEKSNLGEVMPDHEQVTATIRRLFELRMSLVPYLYSAFNDYRLTGTPPVRALVMDWPEDANTYQIDDEFMFGPSLLVAPMFTGQTSRGVYLPAGDWYDFWTHEKIAGGRKVDVAKPVDQIPVFVKANTLLPLARPVEFFTPATTYNLTIEVFGDNPAPFTLYDDDGTSLDFERGQQNRIVLTWNGSTGAETKDGGYSGPSRYSVGAWEHAQSPARG